MKGVKIALDSGAHSLYNKFHLNKLKDKKKFYETKEFKTYLEKYIAVLHDYGEQLFMYVTLDVIHNAKATWDILKYIESCGLHPLPVFHVKSDIKWLHKLLDNYEYFCLGGIGGALHSSGNYINFGDYAFKQICDSRGYPRAKIHGLAMTGKLAARWPWYSVDSITWKYNSAVGTIVFPLYHHGEFILERVIITDRRVAQTGHYLSLPEVMRKKLDQEFEACGYTFEQLKHSSAARGVVGAVLFNKMVEIIKERWEKKLPEFEGWKLLYAGDPVTNLESCKIFTEVLAKKLVKDVILFETFWTSFIGRNTPKSVSLKKRFLGG